MTVFRSDRTVVLAAMFGYAASPAGSISAPTVSSNPEIMGLQHPTPDHNRVNAILTCTIMTPKVCGNPATSVMLISLPPNSDGYRAWRAAPRCESHPVEQHARKIAEVNHSLIVVIIPVEHGMIIEYL